MRVIAGKARRLSLKSVPGLDTRPTTDRIKETLFNILQNDLQETVFLDLYSGSGAIGIEALSRGAKKAFFVENNSKASMCIKENLDFTNLTHQAELIKKDALLALIDLENRQITFDIVFMDPPYGKQEEKKVFEYLSKSKLITKDSMIILETNIDENLSYIYEMGYEISKEKKYKDNKHVFIYLKVV